jgi:hypothetical protein
MPDPKVVIGLVAAAGVASSAVAKTMWGHLERKPCERPPYYSDGDTRPAYRGLLYRYVRWKQPVPCYVLMQHRHLFCIVCTRQSGYAWAFLSCYTIFAVGQACFDGRVLLCITRLCFAMVNRWSIVLTDDLHNLDLHLGMWYHRLHSTKALEQRIHAQDWYDACSLVCCERCGVWMISVKATFDAAARHQLSNFSLPCCSSSQVRGSWCSDDVPRSFGCGSSGP